MIDFLTKESFKNHLIQLSEAVDANQSAYVAGTITKISGMKLEASGIAVPLGTLCKIIIAEDNVVEAEVIGFADNVSFLMPIQDTHGIKQGTPVIPLSRSHTVKVGSGLLGRVLDAGGNAIDTGGLVQTEGFYPLMAKAINPLLRRRISEPLDVGIRVINSLLTIGKGQRIGIFAGSGVGKSVLLGMMTRFTKADVVVVGLIGERGREVKEFIEENLGEKGLAKSVVIASPADTSPIMRVNGALRATAIAEYYRDQGLDVLLIIDSLTRYAHSLREIALSAGELPATKGYTPSVFAKLAQIVERSGNGSEHQGSITAFYTVLVEGDEDNDPLADHARSILDGHIWLSRELADSGHYPAVDIERSISRVMPAVIHDQHLVMTNHFKKLISAYTRNREMINIGMYQSGADRNIDEAIKQKDKMEKLLKQGMNECSDLTQSISQLFQIFANG